MQHANQALKASSVEAALTSRCCSSDPQPTLRAAGSPQEAAEEEEEEEEQQEEEGGGTKHRFCFKADRDRTRGFNTTMYTAAHTNTRPWSILLSEVLTRHFLL